MTTVAVGLFVVGVLAGLAVGETSRRHLLRVNRSLRTDIAGARRLRDAWMAKALAAESAKPDGRDWVPRRDVVRWAHAAELAEALLEENASLREEVALWRRARDGEL